MPKMEHIVGQNTANTPGSEIIKDSSTATFAEDVIQTSNDTPVIVDFWAPWCGPCKQLTPILEKVVNGASGKVRLVKVNIDENKELATQLQIQSIPMVYAFKGGQPVDGFMGALPESQIREFIERVAGPLGPSPTDEVISMANEALSQEDWQTASNLFSQVMQQNPGEAVAIAGLIRCYLGMGHADQAREIIESLDEETAKHPEITGAIAALNLKEQVDDVGNDLALLEAEALKNPNDNQTIYDLSLALSSAGKYEEAIDHLISIVRKNRDWNEQAAREQLLKVFDALGPTDPITIDGRRKLSSLLFS